MCDQDIRQGIKNLEAWAKSHETEEMQKHIDMQASIVENTQILKSHIEDNRQVQQSMNEILLVAQFVKDMQGFVKVLNRIQSFFKWLLGFAVFGVVANYLGKYF